MTRVLRVIPFLKSNGNKIIGMSGDNNSTLAKNSDYHLNMEWRRRLVHSVSPTHRQLYIVMGDALAGSFTDTLRRRFKR